MLNSLRCITFSDTSRSMLFAALFALTTATPLIAGDWPQILGPNRDGRAVQESLSKSWGSKGPKELWKLSVGSGFAGVAVQDNRVFLFHREDDQEVLQCLDAKSGKSLWRQSYACNYAGGVSSDTGPRCVPVVHKESVVTLGVEGQLRCLNAGSGKLVWEKNLDELYVLRDSYFGVGSTPLIANDVVLVNVGGKGPSAVVGFRLSDGSELWKSLDDAASYSSPVLTTVAGKPLAVVVTRMNVVGIDPLSGQENFRFPFGKRGPTVNGACPVIAGDTIFLTASYNIGSLLLSTASGETKEVWRKPDLLASQYATPIVVGDYLYAVDGRQDAGPGSASLKCIRLNDAELVWEESGFNYGSLLNINDELLFLTCGGELIRFPASPDGFKLTEKAAVLSPTDSGYRLPALSNGVLFVRDDQTLKALLLNANP